MQISRDKKGFVLDPSRRPFVPCGFNYDYDEKGRLLEDYWEDEWPTVEAHFGRMKKLGANGESPGIADGQRPAAG